MRLDRTMLVRVALGGALVATLALAGCGRKGPLETPGADAGPFLLTLAVKAAPAAAADPRA